LKFTRLRLSGFKSFVEPTELQIEPGLTAIVGPNGCGKSNLFDALRWVMGESRPASVRGTEMDDVIFAGSAARPARNVAEVILFVDNGERNAPPPYNEYDAIEVSRRIEREAGSAYRINGRDVRQRDVQIFCADASSGAASTAFVRQGQIGLLISQKPLARRAILEEAAGISGLHQRRHEAELRLRAAEANMARLDDVIRELDSQLQNLKRQARQAARYRNISGLIRKAEALAHHLRWTGADAQMRTARATLEVAGARVSDCTARAAEAATQSANAASELQPIRLAEAERGAALHRLALQRDALDQEEARAREAAQRQRQHIAQAERDLAREGALNADAGHSIAALGQEAETLHAACASASGDIATSQSLTVELGDALAAAERTLEQLTATLADWNARRQSQLRAREIAGALTETSAQQLANAERRLDEALAAASQVPDLRVCEARAALAREAAIEARDALDRSRDVLRRAETAETAARVPLEAAEHEAQRLGAEAKAIASLLGPEDADLWPPLIDSVSVESGYEAALAAALGDELEAPLDEAAPSHWRDLGPLEALASLPRSTPALADFVVAPPALARRLAMTGVVAPEAGADLQKALLCGQRLVSRRGDLWRWDGYAMSADSPSPAAQRLAQRNRLLPLEREIEGATQIRAEAFARFSALRTEADVAREAVRMAEENERRAEHALVAARDAATEAARAAAERASRLATFEAEIRRLAATRDAAREAMRHADEALAELGDGANLMQSIVEARQAAGTLRASHLDARTTLDGLRRESELRARRLEALAEERARWQSRRDAALHQIAELQRRSEELRSELEALENVPDALAARRRALLDAIGKAEAERSAAADARSVAEAALAAADKTSKAADAALATAREERARADAMAQSADERLGELRLRIQDELDMEPEALAAHAGIEHKDELPTLDQAERRVEKLKNEREQLGGVNLRAEEEAAEHAQRLDGMTRDRADLDGAIQRLRRGIQSLNREGRERLLDNAPDRDGPYFKVRKVIA